MLAGPIASTPVGDLYRFRGEASFGVLAGEARETPSVVPVRGYDTGCSTENIHFSGAAA
jgi:hypothetical protein